MFGLTAACIRSFPCPLGVLCSDTDDLVEKFEKH